MSAGHRAAHDDRGRRDDPHLADAPRPARPVTTTFALLAVGLFLAAIVQSATGFGYSLVAGPIIYAVLEPAEAVALIMIVGEVISLLILFGERRRPHLLWREITPALGAAVPGLPIGALLLRAIPAPVLTFVVGASVSVLCAVRLVRRGRPARRRPVPGRTAALTAGFSVGVLTTSTTTSGPPLAIWLTARRLEPAVIRDVVTVIFAALDVFGLATIVLITGLDSLPPLGRLIGLSLIAVVGHGIGSRLFRRLPSHAYEPLVLGVALIAGLAGVTAVVAGSLM
jgi:uncharacterized membrane protein YfcA